MPSAFATALADRQTDPTGRRWITNPVSFVLSSVQVSSTEAAEKE